MVTISKHFGDIFTSRRHPGQSTSLKHKGGGEGVEKSINPVGDRFGVMYCVLNSLLEKHN